MSYGIESYRDFGNNIKNITQTMLGGRVFVKEIIQGYTAGMGIVDIPIPNVSSHTHLKFYIVEGGSFTVSAYTNAGTATVRLTPNSHLQQFGSSTIVLVFATQTTEPTYGIASINNSGERLVSTVYPIPQFLEKITFSSTATPGGSLSSGRGINQHQSTVPCTVGIGRTKIALFTIPANATDCWYSMDSYVGNGTPYLYITVEGPTNATYGLPEAYIFAIDGFVPSSDQYGLRIYGPSPSSTLLFDSGLSYMDIKGFETVLYDSVEYSVTSSVFTRNTPAFLIPGYFNEVAQQIPGQTASWINTYQGCVRRVGSTLYSKRILLYRYSEDAIWSWDYTFGNLSNTIFAIDAQVLGASGSGSSGSGGVGQNMTATILYSSGSSSCSYNSASASTCTTTETFIASVSGGTGGAVSYSWSLINAPGFSISGSSTNSTVTVVIGGTAGTYTGTLQCTVSQTGSITQVPTYSLSHTHTATVDPLSGSVTVADQVFNCTFPSGGTCTTSATYIVGTISGGNGNPKTYSWTLVNNTGGFGFTTGTTGTSVGISRTAGAGTYTGTVRCTVSQSGVTSLVIDTAVSTTHAVQPSGNLVSPMVGVSNTSWSSNTIAYDSLTASSETRIWMTNDGQVWIQQDGGSRNGAPTSAWWSGATYVFGGGVAGIGTSYWVRFTRTATTGDSTQSTTTTGWLSLSTDQFVNVIASQSGGVTGVTTNSATYTIEVASTSAGGSPTSTTAGITISASADSINSPEP
jgi:hypothetical protein